MLEIDLQKSALNALMQMILVYLMQVARAEVARQHLTEKCYDGFSLVKVRFYWATVQV